MTTLFMESGTSATYGLDLYASTSGTVSSSTECANMAARSIKCSLSALGYADSSGLPLAGASGRVSCSVAGADSSSNNIPAPTSSYATLLYVSFTATGLQSLGVAINTSGQLRIVSGPTGGKSGTTVITGRTVPQNVCLCWTATSASVWSAKVYLNGALEISASNADFSLSAGSSISGIAVGNSNGTVGSGAHYFANIYADDDSSLNYPGDIRVTAKLPSKLSTNNFDTLGGSGTNRYDRVGERALNASNYIEHAATSDVQENFGIQGEIEGDDNLCGALIVARASWAVAKRGAVGTRAVRVNASGAQSKSAGTTLSLSYSGQVPLIGNTVLIAFASDGSTGTVSATDNASTPNTYVVDVDKAAASPGSGNARVCIIRAYMANVTGLTTATITHPSVTARAAIFAEFSGIQQASPLDKTASAVGSSTTPSSGATATTTQADEVIFGAVAVETDGNSGSATTGMTPSASNISGTSTSGAGAASNMTADASYAIQTATNAQTAAWTGADNTDWACAIATYKSLSSSVGTPKLMNNGTEGSALTLTTSQAAYMNIADGGGYPNDPAAVGMRSSNDEPDTFMYECGMLIAYIPGPPTHHHHKWIPTFNPVLAQ